MMIMRQKEMMMMRQKQMIIMRDDCERGDEMVRDDER